MGRLVVGRRQMVPVTRSQGECGGAGHVRTYIQLAECGCGSTCSRHAGVLGIPLSLDLVAMQKLEWAGQRLLVMATS